MKGFRSGCIVCGQPLEYFDSVKTLKCEGCGKEFEAHCACGQGHYVCDKCHAKKAIEHITAYAIQSDSKKPSAIATEIMKNDYINMHGPEHHYLVVAALLAAFKNCGGGIDLKTSLEKALQRAKNVPGGICGMWGSCGAGIATGIFISIITGATSLSEREWSLANAMTSKALYIISQNGGPRCCKRNSYLAINAAIEFVSEIFGIEMEKDNSICCSFFPMNEQCRQSACLFWPIKNNRTFVNKSDIE